MFAKLIIAAITLPALLAWADPTPSIPGPGDSYQEGGTCQIEWGADTTGKWTNMSIELKTGDNFNMVPLRVITTVDATKQTKYEYPCPNVTPNSAIYFYEFTSNSSTEKYWTTRFTITDKDGKSTPPPNATQPDGAPIPWGVGSLQDGNSTSPVNSTSSNPASGPSSSLSGSGSSRMSSTSRSSSTGSPTPSSSSNSQSNTSGSIPISVPQAIVFLSGLLTASVILL